MDASDATLHVKAYIRKRFIIKQRQLGGRIMEKTPSNVMRLPYVHAIFPESKFIYIIRDPLAQVSSSEFRWRNAINPRHARRRLLETPKTQLHHYLGRALYDHFRKKILRRQHVSVWGVRYVGIYDDLKRMPREQIMAKQWAACSRQMAQDIEQLPKGLVYQVRYEDIMADPITHFRAMCEHVGVTPPQSALETVAASVDPSRQNKWKRLDPAIIQSILPFVEEEMARHGYVVPADLPDEHEREHIAAIATSASGPGSAGRTIP